MKSENNAAWRHFCRRLYSSMGQAHADAIIQMMIEELGGLRITLPTLKDLYRQDRDRSMQNRFNGGNHTELALLYKLSVSQVRRILKKETAGKFQKQEKVA